MLVVMTSSAGDTHVRIEDVENLRQFHVVAEGLDADSVGEAISTADVGRYADGYAWISRHFIEETVVDRSEDWAARFEAMFQFARTKGWISADGKLIRAHVEWR